MSVDQWELQSTARACADLHLEHQQRLAEKKQAIKTEVMMGPAYGPRDVLDINNLSDQDELIHERRGDDKREEVPGGLLNMVRDAAFYTSKPFMIFPHDGAIICDFIHEHAYEIAEKFPAAEELHDLLKSQGVWLTKRMDERKPTVQDMQHRHQLDLAQAWGTAAELAPLASSHTGRRISRDLIRKWGTRNKLGETKLAADGSPRYNLQQVIDHANS